MRTSPRCSAIARLYTNAPYSPPISLVCIQILASRAGGGPGPDQPSRHGWSAQRDHSVQQHTPRDVAVAERDRELVQSRVTAVDSFGGEGDRLAVVCPGADEDHLVQRVVEGDRGHLD